MAKLGKCCSDSIEGTGMGGVVSLAYTHHYTRMILICQYVGLVCQPLP